MNGRSSPASLLLDGRQGQQQQQHQPISHLALPAAAAAAGAGAAYATVPVADAAAGDGHASSDGGFGGGVPQPLLQNLLEVQPEGGTKLPNGTGAAGGVDGSTAAADEYSDESVDGSRSIVGAPSVAVVAEEVRLAGKTKDLTERLPLLDM